MQAESTVLYGNNCYNFKDMKIAVFYNLDYGGAKRSVQEQVKALSKLGHHVDVYTIDQKEDNFNPSLFAKETFKYNFNQFNVPIPFVSRIFKDLSVLYILKNIHKKIASDIDKRNYDIVLSHADLYTQAPFLNRYLKTRSVYYVLEPLRISYEYALRVNESFNLFNKFYEIITREIRKKIDIKNARASDYSLAISNLGRFYAGLAYDIYPKVSYLGVDDSLFKPLNLPKKKQVFFVAPKDYLFGYDLAVDAINLIPKKIRPDLKILFGADEKNRITDKGVVRQYNQSIATLCLSRLDTFGLVPIESMACGTPVIATDMLGYREIIKEGRTGLFTDFNKQELAEKIVYLIKNPIIAERIGKEGRKSVEEKWSWEKLGKSLENQLNEFVSEK